MQEHVWLHSTQPLAVFFAAEQSDGSMLGMKDVDENQVGMAQNIESDTSIP